MAVARPLLTTLTSSGTALVNDIIAPLHFAHDPMQQAGPIASCWPSSAAMSLTKASRV